MLPISTLPSPVDEEDTYPPLPKYYFLVKTSLESGPKMVQETAQKIVQWSKGPLVQSIFYPRQTDRQTDMFIWSHTIKYIDYN